MELDKALTEHLQKRDTSSPVIDSLILQHHDHSTNVTRYPHYATTDLGRHLLLSVDHTKSIKDFIIEFNGIFSNPKRGTLEDTLNNTSDLARRIDYFDVNWVSWNSDNVNHDIDARIVQDRDMEEAWGDSGG